MSQTSVRKRDVPSIAALRARMAQVAPVLVPEPSSGMAATVAAALSADALPVSGPLGLVLPGGGLARRKVSAVNDCPALVVELITRVTAQGGAVAIVGWPELSLVQVAEEGDLSRIVAVPQPGAQPWAISSVLLEGMDLVVHRGPVEELTPTRARPVLAALRGGRAALLTVGPRVPGSVLNLEGHVVGYHGIGQGSGRIRGLDVKVTASTKQGYYQDVVTLGQGEA